MPALHTDTDRQINKRQVAHTHTHTHTHSTDNKHIHITYILILVHMHIHIQTKHRKIAVSYLTKPKTSNLAPNPLCLVSMASAVSLSEFYGLAKTVQTLPAQ